MSAVGIYIFIWYDIDTVPNFAVFIIEKRRKEAIQASSNLTHALVDHLNVG